MNEPWQDKLRKSLDRSVADLDGASRSRLNQARHEALRGPQYKIRLGWLPAAALGMAAVLVLGLQLDHSRRPLKLPEVAESPAADMDLLLDATSDLEMLEDLEFLLWLDAQLDEQAERWCIGVAAGLLFGHVQGDEGEVPEPPPSAELLLFLAEFPDPTADVMELVEPNTHDDQDTDEDEPCDRSDCPDPDRRDPQQS